MTRDEILTAVKVFDDQHLPYVVMLSDGTEYYHGYEGNIVIWPGEGCGVALSIRFNVKPNQSEKPIEMSAFGFDQINALYADISDPNNVAKGLETIGRADTVEQVIKYINEHDELFKSTITGSTGDLIGKPDIDSNGEKYTRPNWSGHISRYNNGDLYV